MGIHSNAALIIHSKYPVENLKVRLGTQFLNETTSDAQVTKNVKEINLHDDRVSNLPVTIAIA